ncbi:hypothetical protein EDD66_102195 [Mobilisporobacter senegalensis]|uniref:Uncharacterized protein n=1 Tax=Mobilisporobacter senegalensis TaxID=1329262 RepID=A0A3N1XVA3_9FIRM|nr:hypothetical protein [Mobilisporobacter senegalensis]ROR30543.1 hypothetical protein EDD66_102195 [Mobilisporobacter senegalensis]
MTKKNNNFDDFRLSFINKKIPILTLDTRWHQLFPGMDKPVDVKVLEDQLNDLMKRQGRLTSEIKDLKALKKQLMAEIVQSMDIDTLSTRHKNEKKLEQNRRLIQEINEKLNDCENELGELPYKIKATNEELMLNSVAICYEEMQENYNEIANLNDWIQQTREALKNKILEKQDLENRNTIIYSNMHDLLGAEIMEILDKKQVNN